MGKRSSEEYRREAVKLVLEGGVPIRRAASDLGIGESTLTKWIQAHKADSREPVSLSASAAV